MAVQRGPSSQGYERGTAEFGRVLAFSDGVFAIAMTLLVVGITVPVIEHQDDVSELADALNDLTGNFISFFISFAVIGRYWAAHSEFFSMVKRIDSGLLGLNLVYLCFIAFVPFPTGLLGEYFGNPLAVATYAVAVAIVSGLEVVQFRHAYRHGLLRREMPPDVFRWGAIQSLSPVVFFLLSVPLAFLNTTVAVLLWFGAIPFQAISNRWKPEHADDYISSL